MNVRSQLIRYGVVGTSALTVDVLAFQILTSHRVIAALAVAISYPLAGLFHFFLNRAWTFAAFHRDCVRQLPAYIAVVTAGLAATVAVVACCTLMLHMAPLSARATALLASAPIGFVGHKYITYGNGIRAAFAAAFRGVRLSSRMLVAFLIVSDIAIFTGGASLERYSFAVAGDPRSSAPLILVLLLANLSLLALLLAAVTAGSVVLSRLTTCAIARLSSPPHHNETSPTALNR